MSGIDLSAVGTRGELLELQRREIEHQRDRYVGVVRRLPLLMAGSISLFMVFGASQDIFPSGVGLAGVVLLAAGIAVRGVVTIRAKRQLKAWAEIDRTAAARALPPGDIPEELLTVWDVRDREESVIQEIAARQWHRIAAQGREIRLILPPVIPMMLGLFGAIALGDSLSAPDRSLALQIAVMGAQALTVGMALCAAWRTVAEPYRVQQAYAQVLFEGEALAAVRSAAAWVEAGRPPREGETPGFIDLTPHRTVRWIGGIVLAAVLAWRIVVAPTSALTIAVLLLLVFGVAPLVLAVRRAARVQVALVGAGGDVLGDDSEDRRATWEYVSQGDQRAIRLVPGNGADPVVREGDDLIEIRKLGAANRTFADAVALVGVRDVVVLTGSRLPEPDSSPIPPPAA